MVIELPEKLETALKVQANARGLSPAVYVREVLKRDLEKPQEAESNPPFKTGFGMLAKYGRAPSDDEIAENRADMFRNFGGDF